MAIKVAEVVIDDYSKEALEAKEAAVRLFLEEAGLHLEGQAQRELENAPRRIDTGTLRNSISHAPGKDYVDVGTNVEYGIYVHDGTRKMDANRFLRNALDRNAEQLREKLKQALSDE